MYKIYLDDPKEVERRIANLTDIERKAFDFGYAVAIMSFLEQMQDTKNRCLSKAVILKSKESQMELLSRVYLLDIYEKQMKERLEIISQGLTLS